MHIMRRRGFRIKLSTILNTMDALSLFWFVYTIEMRNLLGQSVKCIFGR